MNASHSFILFEVAGTTYGIGSESVQQIEMIDHITPLPNAPSYVDGVVFTRGQLVPALNLRSRFGFERKAAGNRTRLIVVRHEERTVGLIVDAAREFMNIPESTIQPPPAAISGLSGQYLDGLASVGERIILILKVPELLGQVDEAPAASVSPQRNS